KLLSDAAGSEVSSVSSVSASAGCSAGSVVSSEDSASAVVCSVCSVEAFGSEEASGALPQALRDSSRQAATNRVISRFFNIRIIHSPLFHLLIFERLDARNEPGRTRWSAGPPRPHTLLWQIVLILIVDDRF